MERTPLNFIALVLILYHGHPRLGDPGVEAVPRTWPSRFESSSRRIIPDRRSGSGGNPTRLHAPLEGGVQTVTDHELVRGDPISLTLDMALTLTLAHPLRQPGLGRRGDPVGRGRDVLVVRLLEIDNVAGVRGALVVRERGRLLDGRQ